MPTPVVTYPAPGNVLVDAAQTLSPVRQAFVQFNLDVQPGINTPLYLGPGNPLTGSAVLQETGGTATCLDSVDPTALPVGFLLAFRSPTTGLQKYLVESGTLAIPLPPGFIAPTNYNSSTQPKYFLKA